MTQPYTTRTFTDLLDQFADGRQHSKNEAIRDIIATLWLGQGPGGLDLSAITGSLFATSKGVIADGRMAADGSAANGSPVVTSANIGFTQSMVGMLLVITGGTTGVPQTQTGKILSVSGNTATLDRNSTSTTIVNGYVAVGTDNGQQLQAALNAATSITSTSSVITKLPGCVVLPSGLMMTSIGLVIPDGVRLLGQQIAWGDESSTPNSQPLMGGSVIMASYSGGSFTGTSVIQVGVTPLDAGNSGTPLLSASRSVIENVGVDACAIVANAIYLHGDQAECTHCWAHRGFTNQIVADTYGATIARNTASSQDYGNGIKITGSDSQILDNFIFRYGGAGNAGILVSSSGGDCLISRNHLYMQSPLIGASVPGNGILLLAPSGAPRSFVIANNTLDGNYGHQIAISATGAGQISGITIMGNISQQVTGFPDNTFDFVNISAAGTSVIYDVTIIGNSGNVLPSANMRAILTCGGAGTIKGSINLIGNVFTRTNLILSSSVVIAANYGNQVNTFAAGVILFSDNRGISTQSGTGAATVFNIAHGLNATPRIVNDGASTPAAQAARTITADATNIIITYSVAPPNAASNLVFNWSATL